jgi:hypothetical protein
VFKREKSITDTLALKPGKATLFATGYLLPSPIRPRNTTILIHVAFMKASLNETTYSKIKIISISKLLHSLIWKGS